MGTPARLKPRLSGVATRHKVPMALVSNGGLRPSANPLVQVVIVAEGADEADKWIADRCGSGDVVITSDIPLAAKCVEAGARVLRPNGEAFTAANIGQQLAMRDLMADLRAANPLGAGGWRQTVWKSRSLAFLGCVGAGITGRATQLTLPSVEDASKMRPRLLGQAARAALRVRPSYAAAGVGPRFSRMGRWTIALNAPTAIPIHQTIV